MNVVLLSGGSGRRLWPLSNDVRSKQFLPVLRDPDGHPESMVQRVYRQLKQVCPDASVTVVTGAAQADHLRAQLGSAVDVVVEPERRDTFPAIMLATAWLLLEKGRAAHEPVAILPVDPYADDSYFLTVQRMLREAEKGQAELTLMGIHPTEPSIKFGYILPENRNDISPVLRFAEKPDAETAARYISEGALWNGGVFACQLQYLAAAAEKYFLLTDFYDVRKNYYKFPKISFDYEVVEKAQRVSVIRYNGYWKDLGTWNSLTEEIDEPVSGVAMQENCENTHILNELSLPVVALGLKDIVIAVSADGILVADKSATPLLKPIADQVAIEQAISSNPIRRWRRDPRRSATNE